MATTATLTPQQFVHKWRQADLKERSASQSHRKRDAAVFDAYGWPHDLEDEEILERLLALNLERAGREASGPASGH